MVSVASVTSIASREEDTLMESIMQAPVGIAAPCLEMYGFPRDILNSDESTKNGFATCISSPPEPVEEIPIKNMNALLVNESTESLEDRFERLMRVIIRQRKKRTAPVTI